MVFVNVNWIAVAVSTVAYMGLGALWYSPMLFGKMWMQLTGFNMEDASAASTAYAGAVVIAFFVSYGIANFVASLHIDTLVEAVHFGLSLWLFIVAPILFAGVLWCKKPFMLFVIDASFFLVFFPIISVMMALAR